MPVLFICAKISINGPQVKRMYKFIINSKQSTGNDEELTFFQVKTFADGLSLRFFILKS